MVHRIVVVGGGYAGVSAAKRAARRLGRDRAAVTVVNPSRRFVERVRLHQVAAGQRVPELVLPDTLGAEGVGFVEGVVAALEPEDHRVVVATPGGFLRLDYDSLVYTLGSTADAESVPGVGRHALSVSGGEGAAEVRARAAALAAEGGRLTVVGGGATAIEVATELAETYPDLRVHLVTDGEPGEWLSPRGRAHVASVFGRMGVEVSAGEKVVEVDPGGVVLADGRTVAGDAVVWAAGFGVSPIARDAGLDVDGAGRVLVDDTLRSRSHDDIYAAGDAAAIYGEHGGELRMACATALPSGRHVADTIAARLTGRPTRPLRFSYAFQCISLGRRDGLIQFLHGDDTPRSAVLTGRAAALFKEVIVRSALAATRRPGPLLPR